MVTRLDVEAIVGNHRDHKFCGLRRTTDILLNDQLDGTRYCKFLARFYAFLASFLRVQPVLHNFLRSPQPEYIPSEVVQLDNTARFRFIDVHDCDLKGCGL